MALSRLAKQERDKEDQYLIDGLRKLLQVSPNELAYCITPSRGQRDRVKAALTDWERARIRFGAHDFRYGNPYGDCR